MSVDPQLQGLLDLIEAAPYPPMYESDPDTARKSFRAMTDLLPVRSEVLRSVEDSTLPGPRGDVPVRIYRPDVDGDLPTVLFIHGGGFVIGDLETHDPVCRRLAAGAEAVVVAVDYALAPEHPFPAAVDDVLAAARWVVDQRATLGGSDRVGVAGDSAGGNLSAVVTQQVPGITAQLLIYPAVDVMGAYPSREENATGYFLDMPTMLWFFGHYIGGVADLDPLDSRVSPLHGVRADLPPAVVVTAAYDPLRDEGEAYADALDAAGVPVDLVRHAAMIHGFVNMDGFSAGADAASSDMVDRFKKVLHG